MRVPHTTKLLAAFLALAVLLALPQPSYAAGIALDSVNQFLHTGISVGTGTVTNSFTNTAGDILVVSTQNDSNSSSDTINSVTDCGTSMTQVGVRQSAGTGQATYTWILQNAPTGACNIVVAYTETGSGNAIAVSAASYSGAKLTGQPEAQNGSSSGSATTVTPSITTLTDNAWVIIVFTNFHGGTVTTTNGLTVRTTISAGQLYDSNAPIHPAGSYSSAFSGYGPGYEYTILSIAPAASAAVSTLSDITFFGF